SMVATSLKRVGIEAAQYIMEESRPIASDQAVAALLPHLHTATAIVAIGSGTLNDIAKMAAHQAQLPYAVLATAPSMNGYTSSIAALLADGVKTTQPCNPPLACLADLDLLARAPYRMLAAGLGDLLSKPVSNADWLLARKLNAGTYSTAAADLIKTSADLLDGVAAKLPARDIDAVGKLMASLCLSGLAMNVAGSSAPASGGEHLISHYLDMTHHALGASHGDAAPAVPPNDLHGCQVGVATLATAALYEKLLAFDPATIDLEALVARHPPWNEYQASVRQRFGPLAEAVLPHAQAGYPTGAKLRIRLTRLQAEWDNLQSELRSTLRGVAAIRSELVAAQCPTTFREIGVTPERAQRAISHSKDIRSRYTILHLAAELGLANEWTAGLSQLI
ncbi:MAG: iron-containing alcohol dehydrogenase, partial [Candidatus Latescibacterota bacterium]|nr:iron-containing alcohol dehydrogenase [Candidatus Latescibacterota bacterium]